MKCAGVWGNLRERDHLQDPGVNGRTILRWIFRKWDGWGLVWIDLAQDRDRWRALVNAVSIKCGEFLDWMRTAQLLKKDSALWAKEMGDNKTAVLVPVRTGILDSL